MSNNKTQNGNDWAKGNSGNKFREIKMSINQDKIKIIQLDGFSKGIWRVDLVLKQMLYYHIIKNRGLQMQLNKITKNEFDGWHNYIKVIQSCF